MAACHAVATVAMRYKMAASLGACFESAGLAKAHAEAALLQFSFERRSGRKTMKETKRDLAR